MHFQSKVNRLYRIEDEMWVVSVLTTAQRNDTLSWMKNLNPFGHNLIMVERIRNNEYFAQAWDITKAGHRVEGHITEFINEIRYEEYPTSGVQGGNNVLYYVLQNASNYPSVSYHALPEDIAKMVESIVKDKAKVELSQSDPTQRILFQQLGEKSLLGISSKGINCTQWCEEKLIIALGESACMYTSALKTKPKALAGVLTGEQRASISETASRCYIM